MSDPTAVQLVPVVDLNAVMVSPARVSFTKYGAVPLPPEVFTDVPFSARRR